MKGGASRRTSDIFVSVVLLIVLTSVFPGADMLTKQAIARNTESSRMTIPDTLSDDDNDDSNARARLDILRDTIHDNHWQLPYATEGDEMTKGQTDLHAHFVPNEKTDFSISPAERTQIQPMHVSNEGYQFTKDKEGFNFDGAIHRDCTVGGPNGHPPPVTTNCIVTQDRYGLYQDANGFCTRGIGIADYYDNQQPRQHRACTQQDIDRYHNQFGANGQLYNRQTAEAEQHRIEDNFANTVNGYLKVQLTQYQFDAIVDLAYNVGTGNLQSSILLKHINDRTCTPATVRDDWQLFHQVQNRQNQEINMFNNGVYPHPRPQQ